MFVHEANVKNICQNRAVLIIYNLETFCQIITLTIKFVNNLLQPVFSASQHFVKLS